MLHAAVIKTRFVQILMLLALVGAAAIVATSSSQDISAQAFVDPVLSNLDAGQRVEVIVTGSGTGLAAAAVEAVGGEVTSDLWLIDAAGAVLDTGQLARLAHQPGIVSVIANHQVVAAGGASCDDGYAPCAGRPGWVTDRREKKSLVTLPISPKVASAIVSLSDGTLVAIAEKEGLAFLNSDGSVRQVVMDLEFEKMHSRPVAGPDDTVYFIGQVPGDAEKKIVHAIRPDGSVAWTYKQKKLSDGVAISPDGSLLYILSAEAKAKLYVLDTESGDLLVKAEPRTEKPGLFEMPPVVDESGRIYLLSSGKEPDKDDRRGNLVALDPVLFLEDNKEALWSAEIVSGLELIEPDQPPLVANGLVYVFSSKDKLVFAYDQADGTLRHTFALSKSLTDVPTVAPDGTLYLPADKQWFALHPDLTVRFAYTQGDDKYGAPVFSPDGAVALLRDGKTLTAVSTATGATLWEQTLKGNIAIQPFVDGDGNFVVGSDGKEMLIVTPAGRAMTRLRLDDKFGGVLSASATDNQLLVLVGDKDLVTVGELGDTWNSEMEEVQPTEIKDEWEIVNTVAIDVGADVVHETTRLLPDHHGDLVPTPITGEGVLIAVLDSGVYVDKHVKDLLSSDLYATDIKQQFIGQYDFVGDGVAPHCKINEDYNAVEGYCFYEWDKSRDPYGHGSHVAGIIWSQITDASTSVSMGIAPGAEVVSVRVLGDDGSGTYEDVLQGIQWVVANQENPAFAHPIRVMNLSLSAYATVPYFVDPINRAVERAWEAGIVVLAAAGNEGPGAETITAPGNDPYIITVGAVNSQRTPGYWADDIVPTWSGSGPTPDGFIKPDIIAPGSQIISFMHNDGTEIARLLHDHPDYAETTSLFRMNGTSMATAVTSGVVALMLQADPALTPDQVKFRLMVTAQPAVTGTDNEVGLQYSLLQQGAGRLWAPDAVLADDIVMQADDQGMDIQQDLAHGWLMLDENGQPLLDANGDYVLDPAELAFHYHGYVERMTSADGTTHLYFVRDADANEALALGAVRVEDGAWLTLDDVADQGLVFSDDQSLTWDSSHVWGGGNRYWSGGNRYWSGGNRFWDSGNRYWGGGNRFWGGGNRYWSGGNRYWSGGNRYWSGGNRYWGGGNRYWSGGNRYWSGGNRYWSGTVGWADGLTPAAATITANKWIDDDRPIGTTMHVSDLDAAAYWDSNATWTGTVSIIVRDEYQSRLEGVAVTGVWSDAPAQPVSCTTAVNGECTMPFRVFGEGFSAVDFTVTGLADDTYAYVPQDNLDLDSDTDGTTAEVLRPAYRPTVRVADIDGSSVWISSSAWSAGYGFLALDDQGAPAGNASVSGRWTKGLSGTTGCVTDASGWCEIAVPTVPDSTQELEFEVQSVDHALLYYSGGNNGDPDGESNGTKLKVLSPAYRPSVRVADVEGESAWISSSDWMAGYAFLALDDQGAPVPAATISGRWTRGQSGTASCNTGDDGWCVIAVDALPDAVQELEFEVLELDHAMLHYTGRDNGDLDGDSNGTKLKVYPPPYRPSVRVADIDGESAWISSSAWSAGYTFLALDDQGAPVVGATVGGQWTKGLSGIASCVTDETGRCAIAVASLPDTINELEFEVLSVEHTMLHYTGGDNGDVDGDSDGKKLKVSPPAYRPAHQVVAIGVDTAVDGATWRADFTFTVVDDDGATMAGSAVAVKWTKGLSGTASCVTDETGRCTLGGAVALSQSEIELEIVSLTHSMLVEGNHIVDESRAQRPS